MQTILVSIICLLLCGFNKCG